MQSRLATFFFCIVAALTAIPMFGTDNATFLAQSIPLSMAADHTYTASATFLNTGEPAP